MIVSARYVIPAQRSEAVFVILTAKAISFLAALFPKQTHLCAIHELASNHKGLPGDVPEGRLIAQTVYASHHGHQRAASDA